MQNLVKNILGPLARRVGSTAAGALIGVVAVDPQIAERIELVVSAALLLAFDLFTSYFSRKSTEVA